MIPYARVHTMAVLLTASLVGCGGSGSSSETLSDLPIRSAELELRVGSVDDPEYALTYFRAVGTGPDGTMYTLHRMDQEVRVFGPDGTALGTIGGRGDGPGELQNAAAMGWVGDTLWVLDYRGYRFNQYDASGEFLGSFIVPFESGERGEAGPPRARGLLPDGTVHGAVPAFSHLIQDGSLTHEAPVLLRRDGTVLQELPRIRFGRNQWAIYDPDDPQAGGLYRPQPFADGPLWSYIPGEQAIFVLEREAPTSVEDAAFHLTKLSFEGDTLWSRDYPVTPTRLRAAVADSVLDEVARMMGEREMLGATEATARRWAALTLHRPEFRPPVAAMVIARDKSIWLSLGPDDQGAADWLVLDVSGEPVARTSLPSDAEVLLVDPPLVYARGRDELDVPYLLRFRVE